MTAAIKMLGKYMSDPRPKNIILRCSVKNRQDQWVWADIPPESWVMTLHFNNREVGVFERYQKINLPENMFIHGTVVLTVGTKNKEGVTEWSYIRSDLTHPLIARPETFAVCPFLPEITAC